MKLIQCPECAHDIYDGAGICPQCGCPVNAAPNIQIGQQPDPALGLKLFIGITAVTLVFAIAGLYFLRSSPFQTASVQPLAETADSIKLKAMELEIERLKVEQQQLKLRASAAPTSEPLQQLPEASEAAGHSDCRSLWIQRNSIFARHGRIFQNPEVRAYFQAQPWYQPSRAYHDGRLSPADKQEAARLLLLEKSQNCL